MLKTWITLLLSLGLLTMQAQLPPLKVSDNGRFLVTQTGVPFFYLADTGWELFHRLTRDEAGLYLRDRAAKGFTVIQAVLLAEQDGLTVPNREGELPFHDLDPTRPNAAYFDLVDEVVEKAEEYGLYLALLPTWGAHVEDRPHPLFDNVHPFTPKNAYAYGKFLGQRYGNRGNVFWVLGGDRAPDGHEAIWDSLALGIHHGGGLQLMTYHIYGGRSSAEVYHDAPWLEFNMIQSGHARRSPRNWELVARDYARTPAKPVLDAEPNYEGLPVAFTSVNGRFGAYDVRKAAYWSVFAGGFGFTYGHNSIWQMHNPELGHPKIIEPDQSWQAALQAPGAQQMRHLRALMESMPFLSRIPDQSVILEQGTDADHLQATRDGTPGNNDATYLLVYLPIYRKLRLNTQVIAAPRFHLSWFDPRTGGRYPMGTFENEGEFSVPWAARVRPEMGGPDWVLVLEGVGRE